MLLVTCLDDQDRLSGDELVGQSVLLLDGACGQDCDRGKIGTNGQGVREIRSHVGRRFPGGFVGALQSGIAPGLTPNGFLLAEQIEIAAGQPVGLGSNAGTTGLLPGSGAGGSDVLPGVYPFIG